MNLVVRGWRLSMNVLGLGRVSSSDGRSGSDFEGEQKDSKACRGTNESLAVSWQFRWNTPPPDVDQLIYSANTESQSARLGFMNDLACHIMPWHLGRYRMYLMKGRH